MYSIPYFLIGVIIFIVGLFTTIVTWVINPINTLSIIPLIVGGAIAIIFTYTGLQMTIKEMNQSRI